MATERKQRMPMARSASRCSSSRARATIASGVTSFSTVVRPSSSVQETPYGMGLGAYERLRARESAAASGSACVATTRWKPPSASTRSTKHQSANRSEEHTSELQSRLHLVCRLLLEKKKKKKNKKTKQNNRKKNKTNKTT